ncbi:MAG: aspartyl protease family protein [Steroidobacteraceae bacterium]
MSPVPSRLTFLATLLIAALPSLGDCQSLADARFADSPRMSWGGQPRIELPLALDAQGLPVIFVRLLDQDVMAMIDSGASGPVMRPALAAAVDAQSRGSGTVNGQPYEAVTEVPVQFGSASIKLRKVLLVDHPAVAPIIIGADLFREAIVEMDFGAGRLTLIHPDAFIPPAADPLSVKTVNFLPTLLLRVNGNERAVCAIIDTGFNSGIAMAAEVVKELALPKDADTKMVAQGIGGERFELSGLAPLKEVRIGDQVYDNVPVSELPYQEPCGELLGMSVLGRNRVIFDLRKQRIWLLPR